MSVNTPRPNHLDAGEPTQDTIMTQSSFHTCQRHSPVCWAGSTLTYAGCLDHAKPNVHPKNNCDQREACQSDSNASDDRPHGWGILIESVECPAHFDEGNLSPR